LTPVATLPSPSPAAAHSRSWRIAAPQRLLQKSFPGPLRQCERWICCNGSHEGKMVPILAACGKKSTSNICPSKILEEFCHKEPEHSRAYRMLTDSQKTASPTIELGTDYDIDTSPPYSPTASEMERPCLLPQLMIDLRAACAIIVNETSPPDPDEEPDHRELLRRFEEDRKAKYAAQARTAEVKPRKAEEKSLKSQKTKDQTRANEKEQKAYARKVENEARRRNAQEAEPERRQVIARQVELQMGKAGIPKEVAPKTGLRKEQPRKEQPQRYSVRRPTEDVPAFGPESDSKPEQQTYVPKHTPTNFDGLTGRRKPSDIYKAATMEPIEPTHTKVSSKVLGKQKEILSEDSISNKSPLELSPIEVRSATPLEFLPPVHATIVQNSRPRQREAADPALRQIRDSIHARPKTSAAACVDYAGPSGSSSKSTTRSHTEYENHGRPTSTAMTSAIITPGDEKRNTYSRRPSNASYQASYQESYQDSEQEEAMSPHAKAWNQHKVALRAAEEKYQNSGWAARPGSRASKRSFRRGSDNDSSRPLSRAGSIAESITSSINSYIRPRASQDSMRSGYSSASGLSKSHSRSSSMSRRSSNGWWRGAGLRRKGSWSSFRSARPDNDEPSKSKKNGEPNLNRPLPALPGLDQYKEAKTHIGQLMKSGGRGRKKEKTTRPDPDTQYVSKQNLSMQPGAHIKKNSISAPILRNESMERTLHRYRDSKIQQEPPRTQSQSRQRPSHSQTRQPEYPPTNPASKESNASSAPTTKVSNPKNRPTEPPRSHSRQNIEHSVPKKSSKTRLRSDSTTSKGSKQDTSSKLQNPLPMIRGPSYQKEVEKGVYPRAMEVNKGVPGMYIREITSPSVTVLDEGAMTTTTDNKKKKKTKKGEKEKVKGKGEKGMWFWEKRNKAAAIEASY